MASDSADTCSWSSEASRPGIGFAQIILRLPYLTKRFALSVLIVLILSAVIGVIGQVYSTSLPVLRRPPT